LPSTPGTSGKTLIEAAIIAAAILRYKTGVFVVASPRIVLTSQLIDEISEYLLSHGIKAEYLSLNSGKKDVKKIFELMARSGLISGDILSTTSPDELKKKYSVNISQFIRNKLIELSENLKKKMGDEL
jgi:superfamily II DNA or RNA helicase